MLGLLMLLLIGVGACKYDDEALWDKLNSLEDRIESLEGQLSQMNSDISSISVLTNALQNKVTISKVEQTEDGYKITFSDGKVISLKNGLDGEDGKNAPIISIDKEKGIYYWTQIIDGKKSWLTDEKGDKIPVTGESAVTPILKVSAKGYWLISYDRGVTFKEILDENGKPVKAVGEDGKDGTDGSDGEDGINGSNADSFFKEVKVDETTSELVLILKDGTELRVAMKKKEEGSVVTASIRGSVDLEELDGLMIQSFVDESQLQQKDFSVDVLVNDLPQLVYVTDENENIRMMARGYFQDQPAEINAKSSALALISMMPLFISHNKEEFDTMVEFLTSSPGFTNVVKEVENVITAKKDIFSEDNAELLTAIETYSESLSNTPQLRETEITEITGINSGPLDVRTSSNKVIICNTGLNPPLEVQVYYGGKPLSLENNLILSADSYHGYEYIKGIIDFIKGNELIMNNHRGKTTEFILTEPGEYYFICDKLGEKAIDSFQALVKADLFSMIGLEKDFHGIVGFGSSLEKIILKLQSGTISVEEAGYELLGALSKMLIDQGVELVGQEKSWVVKIGKFLTSKVMISYSMIHGLINQHIRLIQFKLLQSPIEFNLCYYRDEFNIIDYITCCTETNLKIIAGNEQVGYPDQELKLPLTVAIETKSDDGNDFYNDMQRIKFEVVSGGGSVKNKIVEVDQVSLMASDSWTLGKSGEQKVRVVAIDLVSGVELSQPVYFTANFEEENKYVTSDNSELSGTNAILSGTIVGYETDNFTHTYGICYSTESEPTASNGTIVSGSNIQNGKFTVQLSSLMENQTYYWRAYVKNAGEYIYGDVKSFTISPIDPENPTDSNERDILVAFYNATGGDNWINNTNWCSNRPLGEWYGVQVDLEGHVKQLKLSKNNLVGFADLRGLQYLISTSLNENQLTGVNVASLSSLMSLDCDQNQIESLVLENCQRLSQLRCRNNKLSVLDITSLDNLSSLMCGFNSIEILETSGLKNLYELNCDGNKIKSLAFESRLSSLSCIKNQINSLDIEKCNQLQTLMCNENELTSLDVLHCSLLLNLYCNKNNLTLLDISGLTKLQNLYCQTNLLTSLNAEGCIALKNIGCDVNKLSTLNFSFALGLSNLTCQRNDLKEIYLPRGKENGLSGWLHFDPWGEVNSNLYIEPEHKNGCQYPRFIYE